ncbi:dTMP kinase [Streptomyces sp. ICN441]|uniref:Thymidylate kinase n=1 Tax=Streptomyces tirandamycinicus TaxID=2174846 RepID=A0A2S1SRU3_9ACTN|nr:MULTISPECIES: dTMP kinase [Streptomyces]AWI29027.1 dTMP kinase [Streptomyces tirandamycinicus]TFE50628.1 dTMP kinase [Streptomyces sp. ICN441]
MTRRRGLFITLDGPSGVGKSTTVEALRRELTERGMAVRQTLEPSTSKLGIFTRENANDIHGHALACLVTADRYAHVEHEVKPPLDAGETVICDRYVASTLVLQRLDGVSLGFLLALNADVLMPDLAVILTASSGLIAKRIAERGIRHRFHRDPAAPGREVDLYAEAAQALVARNVKVLVLDTSDVPASDIASRIADALPDAPVASAISPTPTPPQGS